MITHNLYKKPILKQLNNHYVSFPGSGGGLDISLGSAPALSSMLPYPIANPSKTGLYWAGLRATWALTAIFLKTYFESKEHWGRWLGQAKQEALLYSP